MDIWTGQELNFGFSENDFNYSLLEGIVRLSVCLCVSYQPIALCGIHWACFGHNSVEHLKLTVSSLVVIPYPLIQYTRTYTFRHVLPCADDCMTVEERRERHWPL